MHEMMGTWTLYVAMRHTFDNIYEMAAAPEGPLVAAAAQSACGAALSAA